MDIATRPRRGHTGSKNRSKEHGGNRGESTRNIVGTASVTGSRRGVGSACGRSSPRGIRASWCWADVGSDSDPRRSVVKWTDQRGGLGVYKLDARNPELDRCSYTSCDVRYKGGITLPPLSRYTTGAGLTGDITAIAELNDAYGDSEIYAAWGRRYGHPQVRRQGPIRGAIRCTRCPARPPTP